MQGKVRIRHGGAVIGRKDGGDDPRRGWGRRKSLELRCCFIPHSVRASSFRPCNMSSRLITPVHPPFFLSAPILMHSICFFFFFSGKWIDYVGSGPPEVYYIFIRRALENYLGSSRSHRCREPRVRRRLKVISSVTSRGTYTLYVRSLVQVPNNPLQSSSAGHCLCFSDIHCDCAVCGTSGWVSASASAYDSFVDQTRRQARC